jgi:hypothetical protein
MFSQNNPVTNKTTKKEVNYSMPKGVTLSIENIIENEKSNKKKSSSNNQKQNSQVDFEIPTEDDAPVPIPK